MDNSLLFKVHIQSASDLITNSSSESFLVRDAESYPKEMLQKELETVMKSYPKWFEVFENYTDFVNSPKSERLKYESCSGDGGVLKVTNWEDEMREYADYAVPKHKKDKFTPEVWAIFQDLELEELKKCLWVRIDRGFVNTINYFLQNYTVYEKDSPYFDGEKDPETGRLLRYMEYEEYEKLPKERQSNRYDED